MSYLAFFLAFLAVSIALLASNLFFVFGEWVFTGLPTPVLLFAILKSVSEIKNNRDYMMEFMKTPM